MFIKNSEKKISFNLIAKIYFFFFNCNFFWNLLIINTGVWQNNKNELLNRFYFNGINNYTKLLNILAYSTKRFGMNIKQSN